MTFNLNIGGESAAELLTLIQQLNTAPEAAQQPRSEALAQPEKPKAQTPTKSKKAAERSAAAPEKKPEPEANPTTSAKPSVSTANASGSTTAPTTASEPAPDALPSSEAVTSAAAENAANEAKIRSLVMAFMQQGKRADCQKIIKSVFPEGASASISSIPPDKYATVWEQLLKLKDEVDADAAD